MKEHILIEKAKKYNIPDQKLTLDGCSYRSKEGFWVDNSANIAMMKTNKPQKPTTKKHDIETGEDQKGE